MKRLGERDQIDAPKVSQQILCAHLPPAHVGDPSSHRGPDRVVYDCLGPSVEMPGSGNG